MREFFAIRFNPTAETVRATCFVVGFIVFFAVMLTFVAPCYGRNVAGPIVTVFYVVMYFAERAGASKIIAGAQPTGSHLPRPRTHHRRIAS